MNITRQQAITESSLKLVEQVESQNLEFTNRVTDGTQHQGYTEFSASVSYTDSDGFENTLTMLVLVPTDEVEAAEELDLIDWASHTADAEYQII